MFWQGMLYFYAMKIEGRTLSDSSDPRSLSLRARFGLAAALPLEPAGPPAYTPRIDIAEISGAGMNMGEQKQSGQGKQQQKPSQEGTHKHDNTLDCTA